MEWKSKSNLIKKNSCIKYIMMAFSIILIVFGSCFIPVSLSQKINYNYENLTMPFEGQILFTDV